MCGTPDAGAFYGDNRPPEPQAGDGDTLMGGVDAGNLGVDHHSQTA